MLQKCLLLDAEFIAKIMCSVDKRVYLWLQEFMFAEDISDVDKDLLDFEAFFRDIKLKRFNFK